MTDIPVLETERLILRAPREDDLAREMDFYSSEHSKFVGGPRSEMGAWDTIVGRLGHWAVRGYGFWHLDVRETGQYVGRCGLLMPFGWPEPEIGWSLMPDALGHGYATEAAIAARNYAYNTLGWTTAISLIDPAKHQAKESQHVLAQLMKKHSNTLNTAQCTFGVTHHRRPCHERYSHKSR